MDTELKLMIAISILALVLGVAGDEVYRMYFPIEDCSTQAKISGLWLPNLTGLSNYAGSWICINIKQVQDLNELERVCMHEIGHEVFARYCENNPLNFQKCVEISNMTGE